MRPAPVKVCDLPDRLLSVEDAAEFLGVTPRQLRQMRRRGDGPPYARLGHKSIGYALAALRKWISSRTVGNTAEARELAGVTL